MLVRCRILDILRFTPFVDLLDEAAADPGKGRSVEGTVVERAAAHRRQIATLRARLDSLAAETARVRGDDAVIVGDPVAYLYGLADWLAASPIADAALTEISLVRDRYADLAGYSPDRSEYSCMSCRVNRPDEPTPRLVRKPTETGLSDIHECPACGYRARIEPAGPWNDETPLNTLQMAWRAVLYESQTRIDVAEAARLVGLKDTNRLRQWIHRGRLVKADDGTVALAAVARLVIESENYKTFNGKDKRS